MHARPRNSALSESLIIEEPSAGLPAGNFGVRHVIPRALMLREELAGRTALRVLINSVELFRTICQIEMPSMGLYAVFMGSGVVRSALVKYSGAIGDICSR